MFYYLSLRNSNYLISKLILTGVNNSNVLFRINAISIYCNMGIAIYIKRFPYRKLSLLFSFGPKIILSRFWPDLKRCEWKFSQDSLRDKQRWVQNSLICGLSIIDGQIRRLKLVKEFWSVLAEFEWEVRKICQIDLALIEI